MSIGIVVIGRNEGERLKRCLDSLPERAATVVYVDSGSTDGSAAHARAKGIDVVELDARIPFTAARARNEGFRRLRADDPHIDYMQFVDGDCELTPGWLEKAAEFLDQHERAAVACGRLREKHPRQSLYNMLCDIEWDTPVGESKACGGISMVRASAFESVVGFATDLIAGEEPELCLRLRAAGWTIWRLGEEMAIHDAAILRFGQWWRRAMRCGYTFAQGAGLHGKGPERHFLRESRSAWFWGLGIPLVACALAPWWGGWSLALLLAYPLQVVRVAAHTDRTARERWWYAAFIVLGKFPELLGQMKYLLHRISGGESRLIEYK
jgi:glycosyltransferase involved in cell wall biosynthesis